MNVTGRQTDRQAGRITMGIPRYAL